MAYVELRGLTKRYGQTLAVDDISLLIQKGEFFSLLGPSGCGKSTTLRMIAGFVNPDAGDIEIGGELVTRLPPENRGLGIVFQNYAIFPHMHVYDNIAFGLRMRKVSKKEIGERVHAALKQVGLDGYEARYQRQLSGGEQQRVALARVLITQPSILLLDEPLSALDKKLREEMKYWIKDLQHRLAITTIYVTHDQSEALTMSDRIAVMNQGKVVQVGTPNDIYERPVNRFVTEFIGDSSILVARVADLNGADCTLAIGDFTFRAPMREGIAVGAEVSLALRPEQILLGDEADTPGANKLQARVIDSTYQGAAVRYRLDLAGQTVVAERPNRADVGVLPADTEVAISWKPEATKILPD